MDLVSQELESFLINKYSNDKNITVLEIGAGMRLLLPVFNKLHIIVSYVSVDNQSEYVNADNLLMSAENLDFVDNTFDLVIMSHTAEHFENPIKCFKEINRVLKHDGILWSATPYPSVHQILFGDQNHYFVLNDLQIMKLLLLSGFNVYSIYVNKILGNKLINKEQDWNIISIGFKK